MRRERRDDARDLRGLALVIRGVAARRIARRLRVDVARRRRGGTRLVVVKVGRVGQYPRHALDHLPGVVLAEHLDGRAHHLLEQAIDQVRLLVVQPHLEQHHDVLGQRLTHEVLRLLLRELPASQVLDQLLDGLQDSRERHPTCDGRHTRSSCQRGGRRECATSAAQGSGGLAGALHRRPRTVGAGISSARGAAASSAGSQGQVRPIRQSGRWWSVRGQGEDRGEPDAPDLSRSSMSSSTWVSCESVSLYCGSTSSAAIAHG